jgi:hypothetical protein
MDKEKKMSCPHCGHNYGVSWVFFPERHKKGFLPVGKECKKCKNPLGLEGKSAQAARRIMQIAILPNAIFWILVSTGSVIQRPAEVSFFIGFLFPIFFYSLLCCFFIYIFLHIVNFVFIRMLKKDVGYLSLAPDAKHILKS